MRSASPGPAPPAAVTKPTSSLPAGVSRATTAASATPSQRAIAASTSPCSIRKPRIFTCRSNSAAILDRPVLGPPVAEVARAVEPAAAGRVVRVGDEALRGQARGTQVAAGKAGAGEVDFAFHPDRRRLQCRVQDVDPGPRDRPPHRHHLVVRGLVRPPGGAPDAALGGAVLVDQGRLRQPGRVATGQVRRAGLAGDDGAAQALPRPRPPGAARAARAASGSARPGPRRRGPPAAAGRADPRPPAGPACRPGSGSRTGRRPSCRRRRARAAGRPRPGRHRRRAALPARPWRRRGSPARPWAARSSPRCRPHRRGCRARPRRDRHRRGPPDGRPGPEPMHGHALGRQRVEGQDVPGPAVRQHPCQPLRRIGGVQRQVGPACLENAQHRGHRLDRPAGMDADDLLRPHAPIAQPVGHGIRPPLQLPIGKRGVPDPQCGPLGGLSACCSNCRCSREGLGGSGAVALKLSSRRRSPAPSIPTAASGRSGSATAPSTKARSWPSHKGGSAGSTAPSAWLTVRSARPASSR